MIAHGTATIGRDRYFTQIDVSGHLLIADETAVNGGQNKGPTPYDLLVAALGACTAITLRMYADRKQWPLERLDVALRLIRGDEGMLHIERTLKPLGLNAEQQTRLADVAERTPVTLTLKSGLPIHTTLAP